MIQIKRLKQAGTEFVPITLAEAVVVNVSEFAGFDQQITTLDKVLKEYCGLTEYAITAISKINFDSFQKKLTAGPGIIISDDGVISTTNIGGGGISYKISLSGLPNPTKDCLNTIYLVPTEFIEDDKNIFDEYVCYENNGIYKWEKIGSIPSTVSPEGLVTREEFEEFQGIAITCEPVRNSFGKEININIDINQLPGLYDDY